MSADRLLVAGLVHVVGGDFFMVGDLGEPGSHVGPVVEVTLASLTRRQPVESPVDVFEEAEDNAPLTFEDLLFGPCEFLAHLACSLEYFERLADVRDTSCLRLGVLEHASDSRPEHFAREGAE